MGDRAPTRKLGPEGPRGFTSEPPVVVVVALSDRDDANGLAGLLADLSDPERPSDRDGGEQEATCGPAEPVAGGDPEVRPEATCGPAEPVAGSDPEGRVEPYELRTRPLLALVPPLLGAWVLGAGDDAVAWRAAHVVDPAETVYLFGDEPILAEVIAGQPGRFFVGCATASACHRYDGLRAPGEDCASVTAFCATGPLAFAAEVVASLSVVPGPVLFHRKDPELLANIVRNAGIEVTPGLWNHEGPAAMPTYGFPGEEQDLRAEVAKADLPAEVRAALESELDSIDLYGRDTSTARSVQRIRFVAGLPWRRRSGAQIDLKRLRQTLDAEHFGMEVVKEAILEYVAVLARRARRGAAGIADGPKLCLVGPPGVGKTTIARSIAAGLGRPFVSLALGGYADAEALRGWDRAYIGTRPGVIIRCVHSVGVLDGVIRIDEIEKAGRSERGNPLDVLLEVLDPEQNRAFRDQFVELAFDLSEILFIATANDISGLDPALRDRLEVIKLRGYLAAEKLEIARRFVLPSLLQLCCLSASDVTIGDDLLDTLVQMTAADPGVRQLELLLRRLLRRAALALEEGATSVRVDAASARQWLAGSEMRTRFGFAGRGHVGDGTGARAAPVAGTARAAPVAGTAPAGPHASRSGN